MALSLAAWRLGVTGPLAALVHVLAFVGCVKYGLWTVFVQLFVEDTEPIAFALWATATGIGWYAFNDLVDYFVSVLGGPHHTWINANFRNGELDRSLASFDLMAGSAVVTTVLATVLVLATWAALRAHRSTGDS